MTGQPLDPDLTLKMAESPTMQDIGGGVMIPVMDAQIVGHEGAKDLQRMMKSLNPSKDDLGKTVFGPFHFILAMSESDDADRPRRCRVFRCSLDEQGRPVIVVGHRSSKLVTDDEGWEHVPEHVRSRPTPTSEMNFDGSMGFTSEREYRRMTWTIDWGYRDFADVKVAMDAFFASLPVGAEPLDRSPDWSMPFWASLRDALSREAQFDGISGLQVVTVCVKPGSCDDLHGRATDDELFEDETL